MDIKLFAIKCSVLCFASSMVWFLTIMFLSATFGLLFRESEHDLNHRRCYCIAKGVCSFFIICIVVGILVYA